MKLARKINDRLNEEIRISLPKALTKEFGELEFQTIFNIFAGPAGGLMTTWSDDTDKETAKKIKLFVRGYESAYDTAMKIVGEFE